MTNFLNFFFHQQTGKELRKIRVEKRELVFTSPLISFMFVPQSVVFSYVGIYMVLSRL